MNPHCEATVRPAGCGANSPDCRCLCGCLLARLVRGGVELRCRRCKRTLLVPLPAGAMDTRANAVDVIAVRETA
jgi:hypothetical protein